MNHHVEMLTNFDGRVARPDASHRRRREPLAATQTTALDAAAQADTQQERKVLWRQRAQATGRSEADVEPTCMGKQLQLNQMLTDYRNCLFVLFGVLNKKIISITRVSQASTAIAIRPV